ncbi:TonB-dependent receptor [uncultured Winogradskyella sp.]|uniref:SusC/RagA family TonB-linked outer membrane protein n=1 Tax=uncultured Winogradskyella sp. TaxID=395353 RepID=UPI00263320C5|nr:TonB-dependent receptor [uncultured Winogradskyella sp.]
MKLKLTWLLTLFMAFVMQFSFAQEKTVTGTITTAEDGLPLPGASVIVKGTARGQQTDFDGKYSISVNTGDVLQISYVGMKTAEVTVGASNTYDVALESDNALEEVVVVAYGTQKKEAIVGSVAVVSSEIIENQQVTSPLRALQGTVAGINLITSGGQPGNNPNFVIRGFGSFNGANSPLIVIDGAPFNGNLNTISQDQIESISVLKDAASASLYGSRAANGVVLITTKRGKRNTKTSVRLRSQYGVSNPAVGIHDIVGSEDYLRLMWRSLRNDNIYNNGQDAATASANASNALIPTLGYNPYGVTNPIGTDGNLVQGASLQWDTDWEDAVLRENVPRINHNVNISGGTDNTNYFFSVDYLSEDGPVIKSDFERIASRVGLDSQVNDWLKLGITSGYSRSYSNNPDQTSGSTTQAISWIYNVNGIYPIFVRDANGELILDDTGNRIYDLGNGNGRPTGQPVNFNRPTNQGENILASILLGTEQRIRTNFLGSVYAEAKFLKNFTFRTTFNYENFVFDSHSFDDDEIGAASNVQGRVSKARNVTTGLNAIQALNYKTTIADVHNVSVDAIYEANTSTSDTFRASATGFLPGQEELGNGTVAESFGGFRTERRIVSYLGRLAYNYDNRYFVEGSFRQDKSSQFGEDFNTGEFFSVGGAWNVTNESFMEDIDWLNNLKLRGSYGELGNISIPGGFFPVSFLFGGANFGGVVISPVEGQPTNLPAGTLPDPALQWETSTTLNFGMDFTIFNGALSGTVEYFKRRSEDLIQDITATPSPGVPTVRANAGTIENSGWEVTLNSNIINKNDFSWSVGGNFSILKNEIIRVSPFSDNQVAGTKYWAPGNSLFEFYLREWAGVNPANGDAMWYQYFDDANGDGVFNTGDTNITSLSQYRSDNPNAQIVRTVTNQYDDATRVETGKESLPDIQGGFNTNIRYKQFDLSALFNFSLGAYLLDTDYSGLVNNFDAIGASAHPDNFKAWSQPGDITDFPRLTNANNNFNSRSTRWLFKNDYVRLRSLTLGYNLSQDALKDIGLSSVRFYFQGDNLITWQSHGGIDPEQAFNGLTANRSPLQRTFTFGTLIEF